MSSPRFWKRGGLREQVLLTTSTWVRRVITIQIAYAIVTPAGAATVVNSFTVSATVAAGCTTTPGLTLHPETAIGVGRTPCLPVPSGSAIPTPRPAVSLTREPSTGVTRMTVEF